MASSSYDREWKKKLPIGFHFVPTDEELIMYLRLKSCKSEIPPGIFNNLDIYQYEPDELFGFAEKWNNRMYFFTPLIKMYDKGNRIRRVINSGNGCWKASQARKDLFKNNNLIGTKTSLVYYESCSTNPNGKKTSWLMLEYRFPDKQLFDELDYELTLCVIYYFGKKKNVDDQIVIPVESDDLIRLQSPIDQNFNHSLYTSSRSIEYSLLQHQRLINRTDVATTSTMQPSFTQLPHNVMDNNFDISQYLNLDNFTYIGYEEICHIPNSSVDSVDQNKLEICVAPVSQDDQRPSIDSQDHDHQQLIKDEEDQNIEI